jgi:hypothetical protein
MIDQMWMRTAVALLAAASFVVAATDSSSSSYEVNEAPEAPLFTPGGSAPEGSDSSSESASAQSASEGTFLIPNAPTLKPTNIITIRAIGMGVPPEHARSPAHQMALAKRAAIVDGYRQLGEKLHGIRINARDTVRDAMLTRSEIRTELYSIVRNAEVLETVWSDGLCQVEMEVRLDGRRWYRVLSGGF